MTFATSLIVDDRESIKDHLVMFGQTNLESQAGVKQYSDAYLECDNRLMRLK